MDFQTATSFYSCSFNNNLYKTATGKSIKGFYHIGAQGMHIKILNLNF
ncbi:MAG: hypothetical protein GTO02_11420 [Candidatus Dadabacteria bacterium]|nr:hypothetical protein [Candidatus Dadabacteria bacterium]